MKKILFGVMLLCGVLHAMEGSEVAVAKVPEHEALISSSRNTLQSLVETVSSSLKFLRTHPRASLVTFLALQGNNLSSVEALTVTNWNQELTYDINGASVSFLPMMVRGVAAPCNVTLTLNDISAGFIANANDGALTVKPTFADGVWNALGTTTSLDPALSSLSFTPKLGYSLPVIVSSLVYSLGNTNNRNEGTITIRPSATNAATTTASMSLTTQAQTTTPSSRGNTSPSSSPSTGSTGANTPSQSSSTLPTFSPSAVTSGPVVSSGSTSQGTMRILSSAGPGVTFIPVEDVATSSPTISSDNKHFYIIIGGVVVGVLVLSAAGTVIAVIAFKKRQRADHDEAQEQGEADPSSKAQISRPYGPMQDLQGGEHVVVLPGGDRYQSVEQARAHAQVVSGAQADYELPHQPLNGEPQKENNQYDVVSQPMIGDSGQYDVLAIGKSPYESTDQPL